VSMKGTVCMIVIGVDPHKRTHALAALDAATGRVIAVRAVRADVGGMLGAWRWAHVLDPERVWAIEDCRQVSARLERALIAHGERVVRVAPKLTSRARRHERAAGKSDPIDAIAAARAAIREGVETLPTAFLNERALEVRLLADHRAELVAERTRHQNRLRWHLVDLDSELEATLPARALDRACRQQRVARRLERMTPSARVRIARDELRRIRELTRTERQLERELAALIAAIKPELLAERGIAALTAATLIGHTAGAQRFPTDAHFAMHAGAAPIPASSGQSQRVRLNRGGDRQLNRALHTIAITRARTDPATRAYLQRKLAEGKTRREALRCLKRHLARHVYHQLYRPPSPTPTTNRDRVTINAPISIPCLT
jgi:transposase